MIKNIVGFLILLSMLTSCNSQPSGEYIRTQQGLVIGGSAAVEGVSSWLGLPYAAPPIGKLRWRAPQPPSPWQGVRQANAFGNRCMQTNPWPDMIWNSEREDEDCLYLSIWAPDEAEKLPVMLWIHGGGYNSGSGDEVRHDGSVLASKGVLVITINYRLGILGFLAHPGLSAEAESASSGNYALLDIIPALD